MKPDHEPKTPSPNDCRCQCSGSPATAGTVALQAAVKRHPLMAAAGRLFRWRRAPAAASGTDPAMTTAVDELIAGYTDKQRGVIELLQDVSARFGYLPPDAMRRIAQKRRVPLSRLYAVATFYHDFKLTPQGRHRLVICTGTACHVKGAAAIVDALCRELNLQPGETTADGKLTLATVNCIGLCGVGPVATLNGEYKSQLTPEKALEIVRAL